MPAGSESEYVGLGGELEKVFSGKKKKGMSQESEPKPMAQMQEIIIRWTPDGRLCLLCDASDKDEDPTNRNLPGRKWGISVKVEGGPNIRNFCFYCVRVHSSSWGQCTRGLKQPKRRLPS